MATRNIDIKAFRSLSCGLYVVSAKGGDKVAGCIVNTFLQVTSTPARVTIAINKENFTTGVICEAGRFEASVLAESAPMELIGRFGFHTSADTDKFADTQHAIDPYGVPYVTEHSVAHFGVRVIDKVDVGTHYVFVGEVEDAEVLSDEQPMTYAYYHLVKGGKTPPKASSYEPAASGGAPDSAPAPAAESPRYGWRCMICGYVVEMDELPDDFTCPMCGVGRDMFERVEL
ncbi:MAG: flavin reductase [Eggerthellaceae bacterium]|nr:flavin reductase [Eggerthellaceae bacterium]